MRKLSVTVASATIAILLSPTVTVAQEGIGSGSPSSASPTSPQVASPPPGTNSAGRLTTGAGVTTGSASSKSFDKAIADENRTVDRRVNGICRGC